MSEVKIAIWAVVAALLLAGFLEYRHTLILDGEQKIQAAVRDTTVKAQQQRQADLLAQAKKDQANLDLVEKTYADALVSAYQSVDDVNARLRAYAAASRRSVAVPGSPAAAGGPDDAPAKSDSVESALEGVNRAAAHDAEQVIGLQNYITKECRK